MFSESLEHTSGALMVESYIILGVDSHVIHVDLKPLLWKHICKDVVHESLEGGGSIAEPKEHDSGFEESGKALQGEVCLGQKANVYEVSSGATVNEGSGFDDLCSSSQFDREMNSSFIWQCY